jgi:hypothetical protein
MLGEQVKQVRPVNELDRFVLSKVKARLAVSGCSYEDPFARALILQSSAPGRGSSGSFSLPSPGEYSIISLENYC